MGETHYVDIDNGDVLRIIPHRGVKYVYPGGYVTMGITNITRLVRAKLPRDGGMLALLIASRAVPVTGLVCCSNREYAEELGIRPARVSALIGLLSKHRFIHRMGPKVVMVNPGWCFRGTPTEQRAAMELWAKLHPIGIVSEERKTA